MNRLTELLQDTEIISTKNKPGTPLLSLLKNNRKKSAREPADKVYGILGLSDLGTSRHLGLRINYRLSIREIYVGLMYAVVEETSKLNVICASVPDPSQGRCKP